MTKPMFLFANDSTDEFLKYGGGKSIGLKKLQGFGELVPSFFVVTNEFFVKFFDHTKKEISKEGLTLILEKIEHCGLHNKNLAIRSSGIDEDSKLHSFAGQFKSFLFQRSIEQIRISLIDCFLSATSEQVMNYRKMNSLSTDNVEMSIVIQEMIFAESSGVGFSRNPINLADRENILIESVYGIGEGLVGGHYDGDQFYVSRTSLELSSSKTAFKDKMLIRSESVNGLEEVDIPTQNLKKLSLDSIHACNIANRVLALEKKVGYPVDIEWCLFEDAIYIVQMRPITTLPPDEIFDQKIVGEIPILWDNSNIVESFSGVTTPLTFSYAKKGYDVVYRICCELVSVPKSELDRHQDAFEHMLGFVNGRVYYNLLNWYRVLFLMPGSKTAKEFMETMMGVKDQLAPHQLKYLDVEKEAPKYSHVRKMYMISGMLYNFLKIDGHVKHFLDLHTKTYDDLDNVDFDKLSLQEIHSLYLDLGENILKQWKAPIINDFLCMIFFGNLRKLTLKWIHHNETDNELQNDLLCGEGDIISTRPTKDLMLIAEWFDKTDLAKVMMSLSVDEATVRIFKTSDFLELKAKLTTYIKMFGFRCSNEQKLEENDLFEDPTMVVSSLLSYLRNKKYSVEEMEKNELEIRKKAENIVDNNMWGIKKIIFNWVLKNARKAVRNRENMRFARTRSYGTSRKIFKSIGRKYVQLGLINDYQDIVFLSVEEILAINRGVSLTQNLKELIAIRKSEYEKNKKDFDPPERFITTGSANISFYYPLLLTGLDLLKNKFVQDDPNVFTGISCSPGVVEGVALVANEIEQAKNINGEILVAYRTDPGWVPLYPSCKGLVIERGSLLSHSAVVAREMGVPTIVSVNGNPIKKIKTGDSLTLNATKGQLIKKVNHD